MRLIDADYLTGRMFTEADLNNAHTCYDSIRAIIESMESEDVLDKIKAEIKEKIEQEEFARSVFRHEEKDAVKAEQCTGSIMAYNNAIKLIDKYRNEVSE